MKNFNQKLLALLLVCCCLYGGFRVYGSLRGRTGEVPVIQVPQEPLSVSVADPTEALLRAVTASDPEDGELSDRTFVESLSPMDEQGQRTVRFGVFDSDDNVGRAQRTIRYTDYALPVIDLRRPLVFGPSDITNDSSPADYISASSVLDGDLSAQVLLEESGFEESLDTSILTLSVTDSAGGQSSLVLRSNFLNNDPDYVIELSQYLLRVAPGTELDPEDYVAGIRRMGMDYSDLADQLEIRTNYDPQVPGTYEFIYQLQLPNGDFGITKLVVIVE